MQMHVDFLENIKVHHLKEEQAIRFPYEIINEK